MKRLSCALIILLCCQISSATSVRLITIGPGDAFWSAFGHTAIAIDDVVYGFGYFSFDDDIVSSFIRNRMQYDIGVSDFSYEIRLAQQQNRDFSVIELNFSAADSKQLSDYLQWYMLPENQSYSYDYFLNNCSTKVRDLLELAFGEAFKQRAQLIVEGNLPNSYIDQTFPAKHQGLMNFGLALGYGWPAYTARNAWELMAFPVYFEQYLINEYSGELSPRQLIFQAKASNPVTSFLLSHWLLILYVSMWSLLLAFKSSQQFMAKTWFVWHGLIGLMLLALWLLTPHMVADWNFNVLLMMPLGLLITKYNRLIPVVALGWVCWFLVAIYLKAWYLIPLLLPAFMALKIMLKTRLNTDKAHLTFGGVFQ